jgi:hypothetical protein
MALLYLPLDIDFDIPSPSKVIDWFDRNKIYDPDFWVFKEGRHEWALTATNHTPSRWDRIEPYTDWLGQSHIPREDAMTTFNPSFAEEFPELVRAITQMPFIEIGAAGMLKQLKIIDPHTDTPDPTTPLEPRRYMFYLTEPEGNTFYLQKATGEQVSIQLPRTCRAFAFNSIDALHGATEPCGVKILLSVVGILDHTAHKDLIARSLARYGDYAIYD